MKIISPSLLNSDTYQIKEQFEALEKCGITTFILILQMDILYQ